ncbi:MAG: hypothetical protein NTY19_24085 [Planctomycetota bacterium]|nr:hypothetical protein [Planctomycetota bacterium]
MEESIYRQQQTIQRLFGPSATITGAIGTNLAPGRIEIHMADVRLGCGRTFAQAVEIATRKASSLATGAGRAAAALTLLLAFTVPTATAELTPAAGMCAVHRRLLEATERRIAEVEAVLGDLRGCRGFLLRTSRSCCNPCDDVSLVALITKAPSP